MLDLVMLVSATVGSMAFSVLVAYGVFRAGFALMRPKRQAAPVKTTPETASAL